MKKSLALATAITVSALVASTPNVLAQDKQAGSGPNPFSDCGIGAALFPTTKWAAAISNVIWDVGTTAVISATASPETCSAKEVAAAQFINETYDNLAEETAIGQGEHLSALLDIYGCQASSHGEIITTMRTKMAKDVSSSAYVNQSHIEKASAYYDTLSTTASSCSA